VRALTLTQPWAGLVAAGIKRIENRNQPIIARKDFGAPFAIHASREISESIYAQIAHMDPLHDWRNIAADTPWLRLARITGAIIGVATVERSVKLWDGSGQRLAMEDAKLVDLGDQLRWFFGPVGYVLRDVRALDEPVPCRGWQGFWRLPADVEAHVLRQLRSNT
jgi:hypothetical protein